RPLHSSHATPSLSCRPPPPDPPLHYLFPIIPPPPRSPLFPYTTLFRSERAGTPLFFRKPEQRPMAMRSAHATLQSQQVLVAGMLDWERTRLDSSHLAISYSVFFL